MVNLITKSGSNAFHGSAWELYSGSGLNAADGQTRQLVPKNRANKGRYDQHQYGFTAGGPAFKNKLFGFGAMQLSRYYGNETASQVYLPDINGIDLLKALAASGTAASTNAALMLGYLSNAAYLNTYLQYTVPARPQAPRLLFTRAWALLAPSTIGRLHDSSLRSAVTGNIEIGLFQRPPRRTVNPDTQWTYRVDFTPTAQGHFHCSLPS